MNIVFDQVDAVYPGGAAGLRDFSAAISGDGGAVAVLGANGAGKSAFLRSLVGLLELRRGAVSVDGVAVVPKNFPALRRKFGMAFQNPDDQLFCPTVAKDVAFGPRNLRWPEAQVRSEVCKALELCGIAALSDREITTLSGGEKRLAALAGVLAMSPEALLLDEPTAMLDPRSCRELAALLERLPGLHVIATHDLEFVRKTCSRALVLKEGKLAASGTAEEILNDRELLLECGLV